MAEFLAMQVRMGRIAIDQVPAKWRAAVEELLAGSNSA